MKRRTQGTTRRRTASPKTFGLKAPPDTAKEWPDLTAEIGRLYKPIKRAVTLRLDGDVLAWFKKPGRGYQTRINQALRKMMTGEKKESKP